MLRAGQHGSVKVVRFSLTALLVAAIACGSSPSDTSPEQQPGGLTMPSLSAQLPTQRLGGMHTTESILGDATAASLEATHPDDVRDILMSDGFLGATERVYAGRVGAFARVVLRAWEFQDGTGASAYLAWLEQDPREWIGEARTIDPPTLPASVNLSLHDVSGCCHEETPIYLASWRRGPVVWTIRASGPRIQTEPVLELIADVEGKVR
jgi:hypothetical protein